MFYALCGTLFLNSIRLINSNFGRFAYAIVFSQSLRTIFFLVILEFSEEQVQFFIVQYS